MNHLQPENCNKAKCKTCIFGRTPVDISKERMLEIRTYLAGFEAAHLCHTTDKTCFGALEFQAKILHAINIIKQPTVAALLETAKLYI